MAAPETLFVVVHTHWDREWYFTQVRFTHRLHAVMARVADQLETGTLRQFLFDGQTAALEDLCATAEPQLVSRVMALAAAGRITLGPWYVMADQFLVSGESLLRNLEFGIRDAQAAGAAAQAVGYLPDTFGHVAQMPQLLREFGITSAVLWRGADADRSEFDWAAPDGSVVGSLHLSQGYYQHFLGTPGWREALPAYLDKVRPRALTRQLLLMAGGDHLAPPATLGERLQAYATAHPGLAIDEVSLAAATDRILHATEGRRPRIDGELRGNAQAFLLPDVLSTRRYLKRLHQQLEDRLLGRIEPLAAMLALDSIPTRGLELAWRELIRQQAHDSICGCSIDEVHAEMEQRFERLRQQLDAIEFSLRADAGMAQWLAHGGSGPREPWADDARCTLVNGLPLSQEGWVRCSVFLAGEARTSLDVTHEGRRLDSALLACEPAREFHSPLDEFPDPLIGHRYQIAVRCRVEGLSALTLQIAPHVGVAITPREEASISNGLTTIALGADGQMHWSDGTTGHGLTNALSIRHEPDAGDSYSFSPLACPPAPALARLRWCRTEVQAFAQRLVLAVELTSAAGLDEVTRLPLSEQVTSHGELVLTLLAGRRAVDAELRWLNLARDQRTRLVLAGWPGAPGDVIATDSAFHFMPRQAQAAAQEAVPAGRESPVRVMPSLSCAAGLGWAVAHEAMQEVEPIETREGPAMALTLVRAVGWLSRRDLRSRGGGAGPDMATPGAQCLREDHYRFSLAPLGGGEMHEALALARSLRRAPFVLRGHGQAWKPGVEIGNPSIEVSCVRRNGPALELRLWNPTSSPQALRLAPADGWRRVHADGRPHDGPLTLLRPHQIMTLRRS